MPLLHGTIQISVSPVTTAIPAAPPSLEATPTLDASPIGALADPTLLLPPPLGEQLLGEAPPTAAEVLQLAEPTLVELGLAGHTPVGFIQSLLEFMHMDLGMPWWGAIVAGEVGALLCGTWLRRRSRSAGTRKVAGSIPGSS